MAAAERTPTVAVAVTSVPAAATAEVGLAAEPFPCALPDVDCDQPRLTVAAVARRLGVAPATLRTWDRRYGLGPSDHVSGRHRRYDQDDLVRLDTMRRLTQAGVTPAEAARAARSLRQVGLLVPSDASETVDPAEPVEQRPEPAVTDLFPGPAGVPGHPSNQVASTHDVVAGVTPAHGADLDATFANVRSDSPLADPLWARAVLSRAAAGGGRVIALPGAPPSVRGLARSAMALDAASVTAALRASVCTAGVIPTWEALLRPVLVGIGQRWETTGEGVDVEHLVSECAAGVLTTVAHGIGVPANSRPVLLACAEGEPHSLPLKALAAALAERRIGSRVLGAGMPTDALCAAVTRTGPAVVFLFAQIPRYANPAQCAALPQTRPPAAVVVGGAGWRVDRLPARVKVAGGLASAVALIESCVR